MEEVQSTGNSEMSYTIYSRIGTRSGVFFVVPYTPMYTTINNIQAALGTTLTTDQQQFFMQVLSPGVDAMIDAVTETTFGGSGTVTVYASGSDTARLMIPTMHTITSVIDPNGNTVDASSYYATPQGADDKFSLVLKNGTWDDGIDNYQVNGVLGLKNIPPEVTTVATDVAIQYLQSITSNTLMREKVGDWEAFYKDVQPGISDAQLAILGNYRRLTRSI